MTHQIHPVAETVAQSAKPIIEADNLHKSYGPLHVLNGINLSLKRGEVVALIGPSGSGKSTFIRCLNHMEVPTDGTIKFHQKNVGNKFRDSASEVGVGTLRRHVGMVFQHFNLFPHKTVLQNVIEGPITVLKNPRKESEELAMDLLGQVGLAAKRDSYPNHLSGGQKQRVAIARALAMQPEVLLLDEVTSALDPELVSEVLSVIRGLADKGMTMAIVTHEMAFAAEVSSRVLFLDGGQIAAGGAPDEIIRNPSHDRLKSFVSRFNR